jgi:hypothetical protein
MRSSWIVILMLLAARASAFDFSIDGVWYGEAYQPALKTTTQELMHRFPDGSFEIEFRHYDNCILTLDQVEAGTWSLSGNLYQTKTNLINGLPASFHEIYEIQSVDEKSMVYRHVGTGQVYRDEKVSPDFVIPECRIS